MSGKPAIRAFVSLLFTVLLLAGHALQANPQGQHMLWRVTQGDATMYLLGSVHVMRPEHYPLADAYERAYAEADRVMLEIDPFRDKPETIARLSTEMGVINDGESLQDFMSPGGYRRAMKLAGELGVASEMLNRLEPWLAALTVLGQQTARAGFQFGIGIDNYFADRAHRDGKTISGLETADYQISLFDGLSANVQEDMLLQTLENAGSLREDMMELVNLWLTGDVESLNQIALEDVDKYPEVYENLLLRRNRNWMPKLARELRKGGTVLVVVGSLHLIGDDGVVDLLRERGLSVERL